MKELKTWRLIASKTITYTTTVDAFDRIEAESMSRSTGLDWQMIQDDQLEMEENTGYNVHTIQETDD
ncbi:MAG: hypothetical protein CMB76_05560 [Euryarchaeota archaeon]|nr:hypothetical protein [Euryarchaeota archaeon]|tara:strand:+ start:988 stop:1188 length:201 start_codon:yes stop_codon:yes gene_type:complete